MNVLNTIFLFLSGIVGSFAVDRFGSFRERSLRCFAIFHLMFFAAMVNGHVATVIGYTFVAMIFLYGIIWSFNWTPLQAL